MNVKIYLSESLTEQTVSLPAKSRQIINDFYKNKYNPYFLDWLDVSILQEALGYRLYHKYVIIPCNRDRDSLSNWDISRFTVIRFKHSNNWDMNFNIQAVNSGYWHINVDASYWDTSNIKSLEHLLSKSYKYGKRSRILGLEKWNTGNVINMSYAFTDTNINIMQAIGDIGNWDVRKVRNMEKIFKNSIIPHTIDLSKWQTDSLINICGAFRCCNATRDPKIKNPSSLDIDLSTWKTGKITRAANAFSCCNLSGKTAGIGMWDTSNFRDIDGMFRCAKFQTNIDLSGWNTGNVRKMNRTFSFSDYQGDLSTWDIFKVDKLDCTFAYANKIPLINNWNTENINTLWQTFRGVTVNFNISNWNTSRLTKMHYTFAGSKFNGDLSRWDTQSLTVADHVFHNSAYTGKYGDIGKWNTQNLVSISGMFSLNKHFRGTYTNLNNWNTSNLKYIDNVFYKSIFNGDISKWDVSNVRTASNAFYETKSNIDLSEWQPLNLKSANSMFEYAWVPEGVWLWKMPNLLYATKMFKDSDINLDNIIPANLNPANLKDADMMFMGTKGKGCKFINTEFAKLNTAYRMFYNCTCMNIDISSLHFPMLCYGRQMFKNTQVTGSPQLCGFKNNTNLWEAFAGTLVLDPDAIKWFNENMIPSNIMNTFSDTPLFE